MPQKPKTIFALEEEIEEVEKIIDGWKLKIFGLDKATAEKDLQILDANVKKKTSSFK